MADLDALIAKLESASEGSRELDYEVARATGCWSIDIDLGGSANVRLWEGPNGGIKYRDADQRKNGLSFKIARYDA